MKGPKLLFCALLFSWATSLMAQDITVTIPDYNYCEGESVTLMPSVSGGDGNYSYQWTPATGLSCADCPNPIATPPVATVYTLAVEDGVGATGSGVANVNVIPVLQTQLDVSICEGEVFFWEGQDYSQPGTYTNVLASTLGCDSLIELTLTVEPNPVITVTAVELSCSGGADGVITVNGSPGNVSYIWSNGLTAPTIQGLTAGTYCVTVTSFTGCSATECITISEPAPMVLDISGPDIIDCPNDEVVLNASVFGGTAPYLYQWQIDGAVLPSTGPSLDFTGMGINWNFNLIQLLVTDANGCVVVSSYQPQVNLFAPIAGGDIVYLDCETGTAILDGTGATTGPNIEYTWITPAGSVITTEPSLEASELGLYTFRVSNTDFTDCFVETSVEVGSVADALNINLAPILTACNTYELSWATPINNPTLIQAWTFPDGSTDNGASITATETGLYTLTVSIGSLSCSFTESVFIDADASACASLNGFVLVDEDENCIPDANPPPLIGWLVIASGAQGTFNTFTDENGYYELNVPVGDYEVSPFSPSASWEACSPSAMATGLTEGQVLSFDFLFQAVASCPELSVNLSTNLLRRCFVSQYWISVCNIGTETATAPQATLILDDFLEYTAAQIEPTSINGQTLNWELGSLEPGECHDFWVKVLVSCDAQLGQTHCSELLATPDMLCIPASPDWSGANLEIIGECVDDEVTFRIVNTGSGDLLNPVEYIIIEDGVVLMEQPGVLENLPSTNEEEFTFPANGSTYTFELMQAPDHPYTLTVSSSVEGCGVNEQGGFSTGFVTQFAQQTATPASEVLCIQNVGSYDPNDKATLPVGYGEEHYIVPETEINYRIRFQNTGTDTAFTVVIRDTLSEWLDWTTFRAGTSSHTYALGADGERTLKFTFNNILLPDSTTNLEESQGFVNFSIRPVADIPLETIIENSAAIYFDFSEPVITNTVFHTVGRDFLEVVNWVTLPGWDLSLTLSPNPTTNRAVLEVNRYAEDDLQLWLCDATGKVIQEYQFNGPQLEIDVSQLPPGWYGLQLRTLQNRLIGTGKLIRQ